MGVIEITKREIISSVVIFAVLFIIGTLISGKISDYEMDKNEMYNKAVKIDAQDLFEYGMRTNVGYAFVYGDLKAVDTVGYPDIKGTYIYVRKEREEYTRHTRTVPNTRTKSDGTTETYYTTETYWEWDWVSSTSKKCNAISFNNVIFSPDKINLPYAKYIDTIKESSKVRYVYYGVDAEFAGTIFTDLRDGTISDGSDFYKNKGIDETVDYLTSGGMVVTFWIFWFIVIGTCLYLFYYFENRWLE